MEDITNSDFFIRLYVLLFGFSFFCQQDKFVLTRSKQKIFALGRNGLKPSKKNNKYYYLSMFLFL